MDVLNKGLLSSQEYLFTDPENLYTELYPTFSISLSDCQANDLWRYCEYLNVEEDRDCDFDGTILTALDFYLSKVITANDLSIIEKAKASEAKKMAASIKESKPKYSWIKSKIRKDK